MIGRISGGLGLSPRATLLVAALIILWVSGFLSAVIDNIPYTAVTIPLVASLLGQLNAGPDGQVLWWALALGACLGGNGTLIGASANVTVTGLAEKDGKRISFNEFTAFGSRVAGAHARDVVGLSRAVALCRLGGGEPCRRRAAGRAVRGDAAQARFLNVIASPHQPSSFIAQPEFQILVMCRILSPSNSIE